MRSERTDGVERRKGKRSYLNDFSRNLAGELVYTGAMYAYQGQESERKRLVCQMCLESSSAVILLILLGCLPIAGLMNAVYVVIPYALALIGSCMTAWLFIRLIRTHDPLREYIYQQTAGKVPERIGLTLVMLTITMVGEAVYLLLHSEEISLWQTIVFFLLTGMAWLICCHIKSAEKRLVWKKIKENGKD